MADTRYAFFPGCSLESTGKEFRLSTEAVCQALDVELKEIPDWNCCGASSAHGTDHVLSTSLAARNIVLAEKMRLDVAVPCAACFSRLATARHELKENLELRAEVDPLLPQPFQGSSQVRSLLEVMSSEVGVERIKEKVIRPLQSLKVACYYGCLLVRPPSTANFDRAEDPQSLDTLVEALGAEAVGWPYKTECCGASFSLTRTDIVRKLTGDILRMAKESGANCIACACPLCMTNLDMRQREIERETGQSLGLPVFYFTELMGLAFGLSGVERWMGMHFVSGKELAASVPAAGSVTAGSVAADAGEGS